MTAAHKNFPQAFKAWRDFFFAEPLSENAQSQPGCE